jgi:hypothetical protein
MQQMWISLQSMLIYFSPPQFAFESPIADIVEPEELTEPGNRGFERRFAASP